MVSTADAFAQKRSVARQFILFGVAVEITEDGKLTWEDGTTIALGALSYYALSAPIVRQLASRGIYAAAGTALGWSAAIYFGGQALASWIDPDEGAENFADFVWNPSEWIDKLDFTADTLWNHYVDPPVRIEGNIESMSLEVGQYYYDAGIGDYLVGPGAVALGYYAANLSDYVYRAIQSGPQGYASLYDVGVAPGERDLAWHFAQNRGYVGDRLPYV